MRCVVGLSVTTTTHIRVFIYRTRHHQLQDNADPPGPTSPAYPLRPGVPVQGCQGVAFRSLAKSYRTTRNPLSLRGTVTLPSSILPNCYTMCTNYQYTPCIVPINALLAQTTHLPSTHARGDGNP